MALSQIAVRTSITSISPSDGTVAGDACALLDQLMVDALRADAHWNCTRFTAALSLLKAAAGTPKNVNATTLPVLAARLSQGALHRAFAHPAGHFAAAHHRHQHVSACAARRHGGAVHSRRRSRFERERDRGHPHRHRHRAHRTAVARLHPPPGQHRAVGCAIFHGSKTRPRHLAGQSGERVGRDVQPV